MDDELELPTRLATAADALVEALRQSAGTSTALPAVQLALTLRQVADEALATCVRQARAGGHTWQELGDVLHTTRQAAFQRFGRPATSIDPETGLPMTEKLLPGAAELALAVFDAFFAGRDEDIAANFDEAVRAQMPVAKLGEVRSQLRDMLGDFEGVGEPAVRLIGEHTVVDVPLRFTAGPMNGRVAYDRESRIAGLFVLIPDAV